MIMTIDHWLNTGTAMIKIIQEKWVLLSYLSQMGFCGLFWAHHAPYLVTTPVH